MPLCLETEVTRVHSSPKHGSHISPGLLRRLNTTYRVWRQMTHSIFDSHLPDYLNETVTLNFPIRM